MSPLFAEAVLSFGPSSMIMGVLGAAITFVIMFLRNRNTSQQANPATAQAQQLAVDAGSAKLGPLANLFSALARNDTTALAMEVEIFTRAAKEGKLAQIFEAFVHARVPELLRNDTDRRELLSIVAQHEGVDVDYLIAAIKKNKTAAPGAVPMLPIVALACCLFLSGTALAAEPEVYHPTPRPVVIDAPKFYQGSACQGNQCRRTFWWRRWAR